MPFYILKFPPTCRGEKGRHETRRHGGRNRHQQAVRSGSVAQLLRAAQPMWLAIVFAFILNILRLIWALQTVTTVKRGTPCREAHVTSYRLCFRSEHSALDLSLQTVITVNRGTPCRAAHVTSYRLCFLSEHSALDLSVQKLQSAGSDGARMNSENLWIHKKSFARVVQTF